MTQGNKYFWKDDRDVPDMWHVMFDYPKKELAVTFACTFNNRHVGESAQYLGREKTLEVAPNFCRTFVGEWKPEGLQALGEARKPSTDRGLEPKDVVKPDYTMKRGEVEVTGHMQNFIDCVRSRELPRCHVDRAFEEAVAIVMSVESFRKERKVRWDTANETIV